MILAEATLPLPPSVELTTLVVLFCTPVAIAKTSTAKLHEAPAASVAADNPTLPDPVVAAMVPPPQVPVKPLGVATSNPPGKVSVKPMPVSAMPELGLEIWKVSNVIPFSATLAAPNDLEIVGGTIVGGGGGPAEEPPPHPKVHERPKIAMIQHNRQRVCVCIFPLTPCARPEGHLV